MGEKPSVLNFWLSLIQSMSTNVLGDYSEPIEIAYVEFVKKKYFKNLSYLVLNFILTSLLP